MQGTIKSWMTDRGFGWIGGDDGTDQFCHVNSLTDGRRPLSAGTRVEYEIADSTRYPGKTNAINVTVLESDKKHEADIAWLQHKRDSADAG